MLLTVPGPTPRRVLHVAHHALPHLGGLETVVAAETTRLAARGWQVALVTSAIGAPAGTTVEDGVRVTRVRAWGGLEQRFGVPFPFFSPWLLVALFREVRRADVAHVHDPLYVSSWVAALWCRLLRTPYVVHRHVGFVHHSSLVVRLVQGAVLATLGRMVLGGASVILPIDEFVASSLGDRARVRVLPNGVDTARFRPAEPGERDAVRREHGLPTDLPVLLFVGRFVPKKGFDRVAAAAGDGHRIAFAGGVRPEGVDDERLVFLGALAQDELARVYRSVDAFVVASVGECPLTVLESLASGVPVLANDDPALRSSPWTTGAGVRFVDVAAGDLPGAVEQAFADLPGLAREGVAGRARVRAEFSWDGHLDRLLETYP